jgi:ATP-binding cassette subfamily B protein
MLEYFTSNSELYKKNSLGLAKTEAIYFPSMALLIGVSTIITILAGGLDVIHCVEGASVGKIAEFVMYIQMLTFPVSAIGWTASMTQRAAASQKRINEFLQTSPVIENPIVPARPSLGGDIEFRKVSFRYEYTGIQALKDFTLKIKAGEKIAIVGRTGSGKSTIAQLMLRMYDQQEGIIQYGGVPIGNIDIEYLRSSICYVPQDVFLFSDTVENNISFGVGDATDLNVARAAKQASVYDEIMELPEGFKTVIGERGVTLSGGQKQRLSIARALIKDASIVIFDDCLSAVDAKTEHTVLSNLNEYLKNRTSVIITHRIFSLFEFDRIIVLENGYIVEQGKHTDLLQAGGFYADMYARQQEQEETSR